jgi:putative PIN family toxin of toxin-antitoxin system
LRVVLDTNLVLSALVFGRGKAGLVRRAWQTGVFVPLASPVTVQELVRVLAYPKFCRSTDGQHELLGDFLPFVDALREPTPPPVVPICRDTIDTPFMHLAVAGRADALVSGDLDLLTLAADCEQLCACPVCDVGGFLSRYLNT